MSRHLDEAEGLCVTPDQETQQYFLNQTMLRIKEPKRSLDFYTRVLGMRLVRRLDFPEMEFSLYFLGYVGDELAATAPAEANARTTWTFQREGLLELTHNWGTENDDDFSYHNGNQAPRGFGHIGITVPDVYAASDRFAELGVTFVKKPDEGKMKGLAFIQDPDGYWIEIIQANMVEKNSQA